MFALFGLAHPCSRPNLAQFLQGSSAVVGIIVGLIAIGTFKDAAGLSSATPTGLWVLQFIFNLACVVIYIVAQLLLVWRTLDDRWPIGDILFGTAFWVIGQVLLYGFSNSICDAVSHYLDGTFFHSLCTLFAVMMGASRCRSSPVPRATWVPDQVARVARHDAVADPHCRCLFSNSLQVLGQHHEGGRASHLPPSRPPRFLLVSPSSPPASPAQLEFSVGSKTAAWDVKESLLDEDDRSYGQGAYPPQKSYSSYGY